MWRRRSTKSDNACCEPDEVRAAREAAERAETARQHAEAQEPRAQQTSDIIRKSLDRNHFGETITRALARRAVT